MNEILLLVVLFALTISCEKSEDEKAAPLLAKIDSLYKAERYQDVLDSISALRDRFPRAINARKTALGLWQTASLKLAQADIARTDSALQAKEQALKQEKLTSRRSFWLGAIR